MNTQNYIDGSLRPYVSRSDFDMHYPIAYQPEIGIIDTATSQSISLSLPSIQSQANGLMHGSNSRVGLQGFSSKIKTRNSLISSERPFGKSVGDMEWSELFDISNLKAILTALSKRFIQGWLKCIISQPFDVVRLLLQVGSYKEKTQVVKLKSTSSKPTNSLNDNENDEDEYDADIEGRDIYFADDDPKDTLRVSQIERPNREHSAIINLESNLTSSKLNTIIEPISLNTFDMINALLLKEGPRGILKAVNTTFLMHTLHYTIKSWITGFISGLIGIPDPLFVDMMHSPNTTWSLLLNVFSNVIASLLLTNLNLIRTKFIVTTSSRGCRSFREILWRIPRFHIFAIPRGLLGPSLITNTIKSLTLNYPEYLLTTMRINRYNSPYVYNMSSVVLNCIGLFLRLPFETLYARAQVNYLLTNKVELPQDMRISKDEMCIEFGGYYGYLSTLYYILMGSKPLTYEGQSLEVEVDETEANKGIQAVFRGWKVGILRLVSSYTLGLLRDDKFSIHEEQF